MKNILLTCTFILLLNYNSFCQLAWVKLNSGIETDLYDVCFINADTGWCCGQDVLLNTMDGGEHWNIIDIHNQSFKLGQIHYFKKDTILITGDSNEGPFLLKSTNGGNSWDIIKHTVQGIAEFGDSFFINNKKGWAVIQGNKVYKTTNGGEDWITYENCIDAMHTFFVSDSVGFSCQQGISKTEDGGVSWQKKQNDLLNGDFHGIFFLNDSIGWVSGCSLYKTTDAGDSWLFQKKFGDYSNPPTSMEGMPISCFFINSKVGWLSGFNGAIYKSIDGGSNWITLNSNTTETLFSIFFVDESVGYAVGDLGTILKFEDHGQNTSVVNDQTEDRNINLQINSIAVSNLVKIQFTLSKYEFVSLRIYSTTGQLLETLINNLMPSGNHQINWNTNNLRSGVYIISLQRNDSAYNGKIFIHN